MGAADFPSLTVNIGFIASSAAPGVGPYLTFNDAVWGKIGTGEFGGTFIWYNAIADVRSVQTTRGRQRQIDAFPAGTCTIVLDNNSGNYDPDNSSSIFAGDVLPMRPVQIVADYNGTNYPVYYGYIDQIVPAYSAGKFSDAYVTITCSDGMKVLQNQSSSGSYSSELSGFRVGNILDSVSWPSALRTINPGSQLLQAAAPTSSAVQDIQLATDTEGGRWYIGPEGNVHFEGRSDRNRNQTVAATWSDTDTTAKLYTDAQRITDDDLIKNLIQVTNAGGRTQSTSDSASRTQYQTRSYSATGLLGITDVDAAELAAAILYQNRSIRSSRFDPILFEPLGDPTVLWPEVLARAISDRVNVVVTPPNVGSITLPIWIEGMSHQIQYDGVKDWTVTFHGSSATYPPFLLFDDATLGKLDNTNTFGF